MDKSWESSNKPLHVWPVGFWQGCWGNSKGERIVFSASGASTAGYLYLKEWCWAPTYYFIKNYLKLNHSPTCKS